MCDYIRELRCTKGLMLQLFKPWIIGSTLLWHCLWWCVKMEQTGRFGKLSNGEGTSIFRYWQNSCRDWTHINQKLLMLERILLSDVWSCLFLMYEIFAWWKNFRKMKHWKLGLLHYQARGSREGGYMEKIYSSLKSRLIIFQNFSNEVWNNM